MQLRTTVTANEHMLMGVQVRKIPKFYKRMKKKGTDENENCGSRERKKEKEKQREIEIIADADRAL